jgi:hypothetical protein
MLKPNSPTCRKKNEQEIENDKRKQALEHAQDAWCYYAYFGLMRQKKGDDEQSRAHRVPLVCILAKNFIHEFLFEPSATIAPLYEAVRETKDLPVDLFRFDVPKTETDTYHAHCGSDQDKRRARRCLSMGMCGCSSKSDSDGGSGGSGSEGGQRSRTRRLPPRSSLSTAPARITVSVGRGWRGRCCTSGNNYPD